MQPGAPNLSMGVIFCGNHTLKCCLTAIRKFVQFRSSTSIRVLFTSNMCWHGGSMWTSRVRQGTVLSGAPAANREEILLLTTLLTSEPGLSLHKDPLIWALIQVQTKPNGNGSLGQGTLFHVSQTRNLLRVGHLCSLGLPFCKKCFKN